MPRHCGPESELYYYRTRYLDPNAGRFTTRDSIGIWGDPSNLGNGYTYVGNNPQTFVDPFGLEDILLYYPPGTITEGFTKELGKSSAEICKLTCQGSAAFIDGYARGFGLGTLLEKHGVYDKEDNGLKYSQDIGTGTLYTQLIICALWRAFNPPIVPDLEDDRTESKYKRVFRAVSDAEFEDIQEHGFRPHPEGRSMEDKWFSETREGAEQIMKQHSDLKNIIEADIPWSVYDDSHKDPNIDGTGPGFVIPEDQLPQVIPRP